MATKDKCGARVCVCVCRGVDMLGSGSATSLCLGKAHTRLCPGFKDKKSNRSAAALRSRTSASGSNQRKPPRSTPRMAVLVAACPRTKTHFGNRPAVLMHPDRLNVAGLAPLFIYVLEVKQKGILTDGRGQVRWKDGRMTRGCGRSLSSSAAVFSPLAAVDHAPCTPIGPFRRNQRGSVNRICLCRSFPLLSFSPRPVYLGYLRPDMAAN